MGQKTACRQGSDSIGGLGAAAPLIRFQRPRRMFGIQFDWQTPLPALNALPPLAIFTFSFLSGLVLLGGAAFLFALPAELQPVLGISLLSIGLSLVAALVCALGLFLLMRAVFARDSLDGALDLDAAPVRADAGMERRRGHLRLLGLGDDASEEEIRRAFRSLVRRCHPDLHPNDPRASAVFRKAMAARDALLGGQG